MRGDTKFEITKDIRKFKNFQIISGNNVSELGNFKENYEPCHLKNSNLVIK